MKRIASAVAVVAAVVVLVGFRHYAEYRWPLTDDQTTHLIIGLMIAAGVVGAIASVRSSRLP